MLRAEMAELEDTVIRHPAVDMVDRSEKTQVGMHLLVPVMEKVAMELASLIVDEGHRVRAVPV